jgi:uncharacterized membrane protein YeaQ/YmgE (transglycosylase-associated protein family)
MLHILWSIVLGFIAGLIARAVYPGANPMGLLATTLLGIVGSVIGGFVAMLIWKPKEGAKFHPGGLLLSILGAILALFLYRQFF